MSTIVIECDGVDITDDVIISDARFESHANAEPAQGNFRVLDWRNNLSYNPRTLFVSGKEVTIDVDGTRVWGGWITSVQYAYGFDVVDTTDPEDVERFFVVNVTDYNVLFSRRFLFDKDHPTRELKTFPVGTHDDDMIAYMVANYLDLTGDGIDTSTHVHHVGTPNQYQEFRLAAISDNWGQAMTRIAQQPGAVFYINPDKKLVYRDDETETASHGLSDRPDTGQIGYREMEILSSATDMANDVMFWGAGLGSSKMVFKRYKDQDSIDRHGRLQYGVLAGDVWKQDTIDLMATSYVDGSPQHLRGHKDDHVFVRATVFEPVFRVGQVVAFECQSHGFSDNIPVRKMALTFPTQNSVRFDLELSHDLDEGLSFADPPVYPTWPPGGGGGPWTDTYPVPGWESPNDDPDGWIKGGGDGHRTDTDSYLNTGVWGVGRQQLSTYSQGGAILEYSHAFPVPVQALDAVYLNHPFTEPGVICGTGLGQWGPETKREEAWYGFGLGIAELGDRDLIIDFGSAQLKGAATSLQIGYSDSGPPVAGDMGKWTSLGTLSTAIQGGENGIRYADLGTVRIPNHLLVTGQVQYLVISPGWSSGGGKSCDISYYNSGDPLSAQGPVATGQFGSGAVILPMFWYVTAVPSLDWDSPYPNGGVVGTWPTGDPLLPPDFGATWTTTYPYVPGSLSATFDGTPMARGSEFGEVNPEAGTFWVSIPGDLRLSGGTVTVTYTRSDRSGSGTPNPWPTPAPGDGTHGSTGGRVYRPQFVSQLGWGYIDDGINCMAASGCMAVDRQTTGGINDIPHLLRAATDPLDFTEGLRLDQVQQAIHDRWGETLFLAGVIPYELFVRYINEGRGACVVGDSTAFIPWNLEARSEYTSEIFVGPHGIYINEQRENGDYFCYDPAFRPNSKWGISPGWYPEAAIRAYLAGSSGSVDRAYCLFTRRTTIL